MNKMANVTYQKLNSGHKVPAIGLGTWLPKPGDVATAVSHAIKAGYRHIDCAYAYFNEEEVGKGIKEALDSGCCKREDLFVTTKLWNNYHRRDLITKVCKGSLEKLGLDYVDLFLVHWPTAYVEEKEDLPIGEDGKFIVSTAPNSGILDTWQGMEECVKLKLAKSIGVSNFNSKQIEKILKAAKIKPANLQIEAHPYFGNGKLVKFALDRGITVTAFSPFGSPDRDWAKPDDPFILKDEKVKKMAEKYGKTPAQVVLRWNLQRGLIVIPKSVTPSRIDQNIDVFDFKLSADDTKMLNSLHADKNRVFHGDWVKHHPDFPFKIPF
ncbi:aldo-keto reductase family 1 member B1-like [Lineus longissimus]|uniref:aldo-keto reductase family 1 member B1-like n=1 Tax=Lineus longissimus TaxID=88925 RepID=UPI002B4F3412